MGLNVTRGKVRAPGRILLYGTEGVGKSTFAACMPNPVFINTEDGLDQIECDKFDKAESYEQVQEQLEAVLHEEHDRKTLVIDSVDWLERLIWKYICDKHGVVSIEKVDNGYGKGYAYAVDEFRAIISTLTQIRASRGMWICLVGHAKVETFQEPGGASITRYSPRLQKNASAIICEWCDGVLLATRENGAAYGEDGGARVLRTIGGANFVAKNRYNLPEILPLKWEALAEGLKKFYEIK